MRYVVLVSRGHDKTGLDGVSARAAEQEDSDVLATGVRGVGTGGVGWWWWKGAGESGNTTVQKWRDGFGT